MKLNKSIGVIGCGNMGRAILSGLLKKRVVKPNQVYVHDVVASKAAACSRKFRVRKAKNNSDVTGRTQIILLAIKPQDLYRVAHELNLRPKQIIISILAGTPVSKLKKALGARVTIVRAMPNLGAQVGEAVTALTSSSRPGLRIGEIIFSSCGKTVTLPEKHFDLVTAVSGSGPAYFFLLMELLVNVALRGGISEKSARLLAVQTALSAGKLAEVSPYSPEMLRKMVTSKKGTTDAALQFLSKKGFSKIFAGAVMRAVMRARELSRL